MARLVTTLCCAAVGFAVAGTGPVACEQRETAPAASSDPEPAADPPPVSAAATPRPAADAPDLGGALQAAFDHGVVAGEAGNDWRIDPFVAAWVVAAVRQNGDRWLTRYAAAGADGVEVKGWQVRVPADSPLGKLGLRDGDVIEKVSGAPASDLEALRAAAALADRTLTLTLYRVDVTTTLRYQIVPGMIWDRTRGSLSADEVAPSRVAVATEPFVPVEDTANPDADDPPVVPRPPSGGGGSSPSRGGGAYGGGAYGGGVAPTPGGARSGTTTPRPSSGSTSKPKPSSGADKVSCSSASACTVDRAYFRSAVANPSKLQSQATIVPAIANDVHSGYKLKSVKSGSAVHKLGFRSGDKVTHVNGADLTNDLEALGVYASIDSTNKFRIRYIRGGSPRTKTVTLR